MNDPGLEEPIGQASDTVDEKYEVQSPDPDKDQESKEDPYIMPSRWWWASTAFPLIAGTFGPMANAFSICALVENWRVTIPPGGTEEHGTDVKDPRW